MQAQSGVAKVKNAMELTSQFSKILQIQEKEIKEYQREKKKVECKLQILEKELVLYKEQRELMPSGAHQSVNFL